MKIVILEDNERKLNATLVAIETLYPDADISTYKTVNRCFRDIKRNNIEPDLWVIDMQMPLSIDAGTDGKAGVTTVMRIEAFDHPGKYFINTSDKADAKRKLDEANLPDVTIVEYSSARDMVHYYKDTLEELFKDSKFPSLETVKDDQSVFDNVSRIHNLLGKMKF